LGDGVEGEAREVEVGSLVVVTLHSGNMVSGEVSKLNKESMVISESQEFGHKKINIPFQKIAGIEMQYAKQSEREFAIFGVVVLALAVAMLLVELSKMD
jgi:exosome complex RNA-binding protein Csl4